MSVAHDGGVGVNVQATTDPTQSGLFIQPPADANSTNVTPGQTTLGTSGAQWSVSVNGTAGNWTGFTINVSTTLFGGFNFAVFGQPN